MRMFDDVAKSAVRLASLRIVAIGHADSERRSWRKYLSC